MFFLFFGFGPHHKDRGPGEHRTCPRCNNHTRWARVRESQRLTIFFIPVLDWGGRNLEQCTICGESRRA